MGAERGEFDVDDDGKVPPLGVALVGAIAVVLFYWLHRAVLSADLMSENGIEITLFLASFLAQYIPLKITEDRMRT